MRRLWHLLRILILPLSALPFATFLTISAANHPTTVHIEGVRATGETPWAAPAITLSHRERALTAPPSYRGKIPSLVYHGIGYRDDPYTLTPEKFSEQMALLKRLGYHTISMAQYLAWRLHKPVKLPSRPILITFDDGRFDTYRGADQILAKYHMRATVFVIVGQVQKHNLFYCTWAELKKMQRSGRWDIQFHANHGHTYVPYNALGDKGAFYAVREWRNGHRETLTQYTTRVQNDITQGLAILHGHGFTDLKTMAMPFGEFGRFPSAPIYDRAAKQRLDQLLSKRFVSIFIQSGFSFTPYSSPTRAAIRKEVRHSTTINQLYRYLNGADPVVIAARVRACQPPLLTWDAINAKCYR